MTEPVLDAGPGPLGAMLRAGLRAGQPVEVELLNGEYVTGPVAEVVANYTMGAGDVDALVIGTAGGTLNVVPWHAIARVILRPAHPGL